MSDRPLQVSAPLYDDVSALVSSSRSIALKHSVVRSHAAVVLSQTALHPPVSLEPSVLAAVQHLVSIVADLCSPEGGWPADLPQTPENLVPYVSEEAYEVLEAVQQTLPSVEPLPSTSPWPLQTVDYVPLQAMFPNLLWSIARSDCLTMQMLGGVRAYLQRREAPRQLGVLRLVPLLAIATTATPYRLDLVTHGMVEEEGLLQTQDWIGLADDLPPQEPSKVADWLTLIAQQVYQATPLLHPWLSGVEVELLQPIEPWRTATLSVEFGFEFIADEPVPSPVPDPLPTDVPPLSEAFAADTPPPQEPPSPSLGVTSSVPLTDLTGLEERGVEAIGNDLGLDALQQDILGDLQPKAVDKSLDEVDGADEVDEAESDSEEVTFESLWSDFDEVENAPAPQFQTSPPTDLGAPDAGTTQPWDTLTGLFATPPPQQDQDEGDLFANFWDDSAEEPYSRGDANGVFNESLNPDSLVTGLELEDWMPDLSANPLEPEAIPWEASMADFLASNEHIPEAGEGVADEGVADLAPESAAPSTGQPEPDTFPSQVQERAEALAAHPEGEAADSVHPGDTIDPARTTASEEAPVIQPDLGDGAPVSEIPTSSSALPVSESPTDRVSTASKLRTQILPIQPEWRTAFEQLAQQRALVTRFSPLLTHPPEEDEQPLLGLIQMAYEWVQHAGDHVIYPPLLQQPAVLDDWVRVLLWYVIRSHAAIMTLMGGVRARLLQPGYLWQSGTLRLVPILLLQTSHETWSIDLAAGHAPADMLWTPDISSIVQLESPLIANQPTSVVALEHRLLEIVQADSPEVGLLMAGTEVVLPGLGSGASADGQAQQGSLHLELKLQFMAD